LPLNVTWRLNVSSVASFAPRRQYLPYGCKASCSSVPTISRSRTDGLLYVMLTVRSPVVADTSPGGLRLRFLYIKNAYAATSKTTIEAMMIQIVFFFMLIF